MTKDEINAKLLVDIFNRDVEEYTDLLKSGDITDREYSNLVMRAIDFLNSKLTMTKDEIYAMCVDNYYRDVNEFINRLRSGDITEGRFCQLVEYARDFWLSKTK